MDSEEIEETKFILNVRLPSTTPVVGCEMIPNVSVRPEGPIVAEIPKHILELVSINCKWYRERETCSIHPAKLAILQCTSCVQLNIPDKESYHCSSECFLNSWKSHLERHAESEKFRKTSDDDKQAVRKLRSCGSWPDFGSGSIIDRTTTIVEEGKEWYMVSCSKNYIPKADNLGSRLMLECEAVHRSRCTALSQQHVIVTNPVIEFPAACPRCMVKIQYHDKSPDGIAFSILSYNILADMYAYGMYDYCPEWALIWEFRRQNLLKEITGYNADIICLQEVQSDHFEHFFEPEMKKRGYLVIYKERSNKVYSYAKQYITDGCATFYRHDLFKEKSIYEVEFDKKISLVVELQPPELRDDTRIRYTKDNVALIVILETLENGCNYNTFQSRICVVNTHICSNPELSDVKLFQVVSLINELEKILNPEIPLLICGDFNSLPESAPYTFIASATLKHTEQDKSVDKYRLYQCLKLVHPFSLASAYASFGLLNTTEGSRDRSKFDAKTREPKFTNSTSRFSGTLDYIFFTADKLEVEGLLEIPDDAGPFPSAVWSSDHIALMAKFRILAKNPGM